MQPDRATNNGGRTMEVKAAAPRCQLLLIVLMAVMLLPGMEGSPLLIQRTVTRTFVLQETIGKARAFATQAALNDQLHRGIMLVNQQVDLLQEQVDVLSQVITTACIVPMSGLCLTSVQYNNMTRAANLSKSISSMLTGVWMAEFDNITTQLRTEIVAINVTCVPVASAEEMLTWLHSSISFLKEWAGLGALAGMLVLASVACLWCLCKIRRSQQRKAVMIIQAFTAIEAGQSPQAWLAVLKD
ncbi:hypothetical protein STEG23_006615 [Scotinomys teguina]